jgi:fatty-acyl-CoA synthase
VGIWAPNCAEWVLVQYATAKIGAILVNVNPAYRTHELEYVLRQSGVRLLFSASAFKTSDYAAMIEEVGRASTRSSATVFVDRDGVGRVLRRRARPRGDRRAHGRLSLRRPINIQYTSGTTGFPKGATLSHHNILNNGFFVTELIGHRADVTCLPVPFYHCFGMVMGNLGTLAHGGCVVIPAPSFEPRATLEAVAAEGVTSLYGVPTMFIAMLDHEEFDVFDLGSLRTGIMAGSPCPIEVMKKVVERMHMSEVAICYGMTETSPVSTQNARRRPARAARGHGRARRAARRGQGRRPGERPRRRARRARRAVHARLQRDARILGGRRAHGRGVDRAGWMHTGDLATMDDEGYLNIVGRSKDMVIRGGENVYPREIEEFLYTHDGDRRRAGRRRARRALRGGAVRLGHRAPGAELDDDDVRDFCRGAWRTSRCRAT